MQREGFFCILVYVNLLIASSQKIVRSALTMMVSNAPDMTVVGQAESTTDLLAQVKAIPPSSFDISQLQTHK